MIKKCVQFILLMGSRFLMHAQQISPTAEPVKKMISNWEGERFADGFYYVSNAIFQPSINVSLKAAFGLSYNKEFQHQSNFFVLRKMIDVHMKTCT